MGVTMKTIAPTAEQRSMKESILASFAQLEKNIGSADSPFLRRLRNTAIARFDELGFPGLKDEEWRFTPLQSLYRQQFSLADKATELKLAPKRPSFLLPKAIRMVFVDGFFDPALSTLADLPAGCRLTTVSESLQKNPQPVESTFGRLTNIESNVFAALNSAFVQDGIVLHLAANCVVDRPIHLQFLETGRGVMSFPRILAIADHHSQACIVETHSTLGSAADFTSAVSEISLADEARIDHYRINDVSTQSFHFAAQHVKQQRGSNFRSHAITLGGSLVRNDISASLASAGCECTLNGLYFVDGNRLVDNHTIIDHAMPHCNSHELYKGIITDKGKGVFNGKIFVRQDAQKTDAKQTNQTLLLSPDAAIDTKPQLEIFADDVKCTHGATVGQLDDEMLFYLRTRGIGKNEAEAMLQYAFANDILERIEVAPLRETLERRFLSARAGKVS
jgi:Fe-S cluster assembly protein SufD